MRVLAVALCTAAICSSVGCSRQTTLTVGGLEIAAGATSLAIGTYGIDHSSSAPDDRLIYYPFGAALIGIGVVTLLIGLATAPEP